MRRHATAFLFGLILTSVAFADDHAHPVHLGVVNAIQGSLSAGFGKAADAARAPTIKDQWKLTEVARDEALSRLATAGYDARSVELPTDLARIVRRGGALDVGATSVRLDTAFRDALERWMREQKLDGVVVLRSLARPLAEGASVQSGYGIARRGTTSVAYANLAPLLITGSPPAIKGAPQCLVTEPVDANEIAHPKSLTDLASLRPALERALRKSVDGALIRTGAMNGELACE